MRAGLLSFAHPGFMGIGAYTSTLLMMKAKLPFFIAFPAAGVVPALMALIFGPIILRLKGVYFVLTSFLLGEVIRLIFVNWQSLCGGSGGIFDIPAATLGPISLAGKVPLYQFALATTILVCAVCFSLVRSEFGRALSAIDEDDTLAECTGVNTFKYKVLAFCIGAFLVGLAGSIFAHYIRYISPIDFTWRLGLDFIAYNVVGGITALLGAGLGTLILMPLPEILRDAAEYQWILYSLVMILMLRFMPGGLASVRFKRKKTNVDL